MQVRSGHDISIHMHAFVGPSNSPLAGSWRTRHELEWKPVFHLQVLLPMVRPINMIHSVIHRVADHPDSLSNLTH